VTYDGELTEAFPPQAITVTLEDEIDVSRGDMLVPPDDLPLLDARFNANIVWMTDSPLIPGKQYYIKQTTKTATGSVSKIHYRSDVNTLERYEAGQLRLNEIGLCELALIAPIAFDPYTRSKGTGAFIVIDRLSNVTVGAGMIVGLAAREGETRKVSPAERAARFGQKAITLWLTGADRREAAYRLERCLFDRGYACTVLDDENLGANATTIAHSLNHAGLICVCTLDHAPPSDDAGNLTLSADNLDVDEVIMLLHRPHGIEDSQPDFVI